MKCGCGGDCSKSKSILKGVKYTVPKNMSITDYFRKCLLVDSTIKPNNPAILSGDGKCVAFTFRELDSLSTKFAKALRQSLGFWTSNNPDGDLVMAFSLPISEIIPVVILAILKLGAAFLVIPTTFAEQHILKLVGVTRPLVVIIDSSSKPTIARYECVSGLLQVLHLDDILHLAQVGGFDDVNEVFPLEALVRPSQRMASIVYTAGTMGQQLAVRLGQVEILNRCLWQYRTFPYEGKDVGSVSSCLEDVDSISEIFAPLLAGIPLHLIPRYVLANPTALIGRIFDAKISRITLAPPALNALLNAYEQMPDEEKQCNHLSTLKYWTISGDTLPLPLAKKFFKLIANDDFDDWVNQPNHHHHQKEVNSKAQSNRLNSFTSLRSNNNLDSRAVLIHLYGSTEVMSDVSYETFENCSHVHRKFIDCKVSIGRPIGNTIIYVVDEDMHIVQDGTIGEICVAGACVATGGYVDGTENDDTERFRPNPFTKNKKYSIMYETEDFGRIIKDKYGVRNLFFEGRTENIAKVNGKRVDLREIARSVNKTKLVQQCCVFCYNPGNEDEAIVACCKLKEDSTESDVQKSLESSIKDKDFIPEIFPVDEFKYLPSGRLDKHKMFKMYKYHILNATPQEWEAQTGLSHFLQKNAAKVLFTAIAMYTKNQVRFILSNCKKSIWDIGVNSVNALAIFLAVRENGYVLDLADFIHSKSILNIVFNMRAKVRSDGPIQRSAVFELIEPLSEVYQFDTLQQSEKGTVIELLSKGCARKHYLHCYLPVTSEDWKHVLEVNWSQITKNNLSVVAYSRTKQKSMVGALIVLDGYNRLKIPPNCAQPIKYLEEMFLCGEKKPKEHIIWKKKGTAIQFVMMSTSCSLSTQENLLLILALIDAAKFKAKMVGYEGAIVSTTNPLIRNLCDGIMHDMLYEDTPINKFQSKDKTRPFRLAPPYMKHQVFYETF